MHSLHKHATKFLYLGKLNYQTKLKSFRGNITKQDHDDCTMMLDDIRRIYEQKREINKKRNYWFHLFYYIRLICIATTLLIMIWRHDIHLYPLTTLHHCFLVCILSTFLVVYLQAETLSQTVSTLTFVIGVIHNK